MMVREMLTKFPQIKIILVHKVSQEDLILEAFRQGVVGHIPRGNDSPEEIINAVRAAIRGEVILSSSIAGTILDEILREQQKISSEKITPTFSEKQDDQ